MEASLQPSEHSNSEVETEMESQPTVSQFGSNDYRILTHILLQRPEPAAAKDDFSQWYLRQVTKELEDDLDQIRGSADFNENSLPILINALQQGEALFSKEEKMRIVSRGV